MKRIFTHLFIAVLLMLSSTSWAQKTSLEDGEVYTFANYSQSGYSLSATSLTDVNTAATDNAQNSQLWYVEKSGSYYTFRNLANGKYLQGAGTSTPWSLADNKTSDAALFEIVTVGTSYNTIRSKSQSSNGHGYMHYSSSQGDVVGWNTSANASWWTITDMNYTDEQIQAAWDLVDSFVLSDELVESYQTVLDKIFNDKACTTPKLATFAQAQAVDGYSGLPAALKDLVEKVYNNKTWEETNSDNQAVWSNDYARRFRVQMYEPYSIAGDITNFLGMNAHNNMDNPTGIYANAQEAMYIMVEEEPASGSELYVGYIAGHGQLSGYKSYTKLKKGLNAVPYFADGSQLWIMYLVDTYNPDGATDRERFPNKLSNYKPIKINIAGGHINGYYNAIGDYLATTTATEDLWGEVDNDEDWAYYSPRVALTSSDFTLLGHRQTLQFLYDNVSTGDKGIAHYLNDVSKDGDNEYINVPSEPYCNSGNWDDYTNMNLDPATGEINIMLEAWDRIMYSEHATLGLVSNSTMKKMNEMYPRWNADGTKGDVYTYDKPGPDGKTYKEFCGVDYSEYFNHHGVALGGDWSNLYMSAGGSACNYHYNTLGSIITEIATSPGSLWGPAHEIGHQHQSVFNIRGGTEVTNNVFSNAAVWYMGMATSRVNGNEGSLEQVLKEYYAGKPFIDYNIWSMTQMFYKLWLYYHLAGNNTQFYPRFFEMLRRDPLQANGSTATGSQSMLKIYEKMCDAAGEDLTEFFRIHGFFVLLDNYAKEDYGTTVFTQTQEEVNAAIARVQEKYGKEKNYAVIFINDATENTGVQHDGKTPRELWDENASAEYGSYIDIVNGEDDVETPYTAVLNADNTITMTGGKGGLGFILIDNETDKVLAFSNKSTFALSDEVSYLLATNKITISTVNGRSELTRAEVDFNAMQKELLEALVADVEAMPIDDGTYTHVGFYKKAFATDILTALEKAKSVLEAGKGGYAAAYEILYSEYTNPDSKITLDLNKKYIISNNAYTTRNIVVVDGATVRALENNTTAAAQWSFVETGTAGSYYLKNDEGYYCPAVVTGDTGGNATKEQASAGVYTLKELEHGLWAIVGEKASMHASASQSYNIVGWSYDATASQWYITASVTDEKAAEVNELQALIAKTETLVNEVAIVELSDGDTPVALQTTNPNGNFYVRTNATNTGGSNEGPIANLVDGGVNNFFHTQYANSAKSDDNLDHYIEVSMGSGALSAFKFSYTTRAGVANDYPQTIKVYGSNTENKTGDKSGYVLLATISSGLPSSSTQTTYTHPSVIDAGIAYKYLRFMVPTTSTDRVANNGAEHNYWHMAEFDILPVNTTATLRDGFTSINNETVVAAYHAMKEAAAWLTYPSLTSEQLTTAKTALQSAYDALVEEYSGVVDVKKTELQELIDATKLLVSQVGTFINNKEEVVALSTSNVYCNATIAEGELGNLFKDDTSFMHTQWNGKSADSDYHYLRVDLGEDNSIGEFYFTYTTANRTYQDMPKTIIVEGANEIDSDNSTKDTFTEIATLTAESDGLPQATGKYSDFVSKVLGCTSTPYRYLRFRVTAIGRGTSTGDIADDNGYPFFTMAKFGLTKAAYTTVAINDAYKNTEVTEELLIATDREVADAVTMKEIATSEDLLLMQIDKLQAAKAALEEAMAKKALADLAELIQATQELCDEMSTPEGAVAEYYLSSSLTADNLAAVAAEIADADAVCKNLSATYADIKAAYTELEAEYNLLKNIKDSDVVDREQLAGLIATMEELLAATTNTIAQGTLALQCTDEKAPLYIKLSRVGDGSVANMIDKNDDGTANTGTYVGTAYGDGIADYTHYVQVYLGEKTILGDLTFGYATRNSTHSTERPEAIKVLGSDDGEHYTEIALIDEGLATGAGEQWTLQTPLAVYAKYSYIRFAVKSGVNSFHMSDFNLYTNGLTSVNNKYSPSDIANYLPAALREYNNSKNVAATYITTDSYSALVESLQAQIDALQGVIDANVTDRTSLAKLVGETKDLVTEIAAVNEEETAIVMQCTNENAPYYLYCNADGTETNGDGDRAGVAALVGDNATNSTHLHTTYNNKTQKDDLDHYLRLDMGENEAMVSFKFRYTGRINNVNNAPTKMLIEGSNDLENFDEIATLDIDVPESGTATYSTEDALGNGKAYRYIRFMVKDTKNHASNNGHPFFVLSQFAVTACKTIEVAQEYASPNLSLSTLVAANNEVVDGTTVKEQFYVTETVYNTAVTELKAAKDALEAAIALKNIPVKLTTDANNPVLYKIRINRSYAEYASLQYDDDSKVAVAAMEFATANAQSWYFMQGTDGCVLILPYTAGGNVLATNSFSEGNSKVVAKEKDTEGFSQNWEISKIDGKEWYNIKIKNTDGTYYYFSNHGGDGKKMGFYNSNASSDGGSMFKFILDEAYAIVEEAFASYGREPEYTDVPGYLATDDYNNAYDAVAGYIENKNGEDADVFDAFDALKTAKTNATYVPSHSLEHGAVYRIMNLIINTETRYKYHYIANNNAAISFPTEPKTDGSDLWVCIQDGDKYKFVSALGTATLGWDYTIIETNAGAVKENATKFVVDDKTSVNGAKRIAESNNSMSLTNELWNSKGEALFNRAGNDGKAQSSNWSTDWYFQKVENADIKFKVKITKKFSSLYLPYSVVVPDGVGAFTAVDVDGTAVELVRVADKLGSSRHGTIIPARTPVVVYIEDENVVTAEYEFKYTTEDANLPEDVQSAVDNDAIIYGKILKTPVQCEDAYRYYKLGSKSSDEVAKMYWMYKEYNASGERLYPNTDDGTHISCTANKIYMKVPETLAAKSFTMRFAKGDGATDIDNVKEENGNVKTIYDLQGRKLSEITEPGIYIVDGKKVFVK